MTRFSLASLVANALTGNRNWQAQWHDAEPKTENRHIQDIKSET